MTEVPSTVAILRPTVSFEFFTFIATLALVFATGVLAWATFKLSKFTGELTRIEWRRESRDRAQFQVNPVNGFVEKDLDCVYEYAEGNPHPVSFDWEPYFKLRFNIVVSNSGYRDGAIDGGRMTVLEGKLVGKNFQLDFTTSSTISSKELKIASGNKCSISCTARVQDDDHGHLLGTKCRLQISPVIRGKGTDGWAKMTINDRILDNTG